MAARKANKLGLLLLLFGIGFIFNFVWELLQMPIYDVPWEIWSAECILVCALATLWDAGYIVSLYLLLAVLNRNFYWLKDWDLKDVFVILFVGLATATFVEVRALDFGKWNYLPQMPRLPLGVGLTPVLQLPALSLLSFFVLKKLKNAGI